MAWWKYKPLEVRKHPYYDARIGGWPAVVAVLGAAVFIAAWAWEDEEGRSALTVAGMVAGFAIAVLGFHLDSDRKRPRDLADLRAGKTRSPGSPPPPA